MKKMLLICALLLSGCVYDLPVGSVGYYPNYSGYYGNYNYPYNYYPYYRGGSSIYIQPNYGFGHHGGFGGHHH